MAVLTAKCRRAFVVSPEQSKKKLLEQKTNSKTQNKKESKKIRKNNFKNK